MHRLDRSDDAVDRESSGGPELPIAISMIAGRYLLFDIDAAIYLRREHNICGYNIGTLAQLPSQNGFLGLPIILMPEEAQVLVDKGVGYVFNDKAAHRSVIFCRDDDRVASYRAGVNRHAAKIQAARASYRADTSRRHQHHRSLKSSRTDEGADTKSSLLDFDEEDADPEPSSWENSTTISEQSDRITPTSSALLFDNASHIISRPKTPLVNLPRHYALFRHLHSKKYFMTPGLRFGCQYSTYPGDPLRFHSHFLTTDLGWEQGMDLMDVVGGGRLGTGVKKGFLIGSHTDNATTESTAVTEEAEVRTFSVEWAVM